MNFIFQRIYLKMAVGIASAVIYFVSVLWIIDQNIQIKQEA